MWQLTLYYHMRPPVASYLFLLSQFSFSAMFGISFANFSPLVLKIELRQVGNDIG